jgi:hypothetical protein
VLDDFLLKGLPGKSTGNRGTSQATSANFIAFHRRKKRNPAKAGFPFFGRRFPSCRSKRLYRHHANAGTSHNDRTMISPKHRKRRMDAVRDRL